MEKAIYTSYQEAFRAKLVELREAAGLTQRQLALKLGRVPSVIAHIEKGQRRVDTLELYRICKACGASAEKVAAELMKTYARLDKSKGKR